MSFQKAKSLDELNLLIEKAKTVEKARQMFNDNRVSSGIDAPSSTEANLAKQQELEVALGRLLGPQQRFFSEGLRVEEEKKKQEEERKRLLKEQEARDEEAVRIELEKAREERDRTITAFMNDIQSKALNQAEELTIDNSVEILTDPALVADDGIISQIRRDNAEPGLIANLYKAFDLFSKLNSKDQTDRQYLREVKWDTIELIASKLGITAKKAMPTSAKSPYIKQHILPALSIILNEAVERQALEMYDQTQTKPADEFRTPEADRRNPDAEQAGPGTDDKEQEGFGLKRKKNHGFKVNVNDGSFGEVFINLPKLIAELKLEVMNKQDKKVLTKKVQPDFIDMLLKRYNPKKRYDPSTIETFKQVVSLAKLPLYGEHSTKLAIINPEMKKPQMGGCPGTIMVMKVPEAVKKIPVLIGQIEAGNNNPLVKNQLSELVQFLVREGKMSKVDGAEIINEYVLG